MSKFNTSTLCCFVLLCVLGMPSFLHAWTGKVVGITDGDTIKVLHDNKQVKIRLHGIDTPDKAQAFGKKAKKFTAGMVAGKIVNIKKPEKNLFCEIRVPVGLICTLSCLLKISAPVTMWLLHGRECE